MTAVLTTLQTTTTLVLGIAPNPVDEGTLRPDLDPSQVTPGTIGFLITLFLAVAAILLLLDFNRRNRRLRYRAEYAERRAAQEGLGGYAGRHGAAGAVPETGPEQDGAPPSSPETDERGRRR